MQLSNSLTIGSDTRNSCEKQHKKIPPALGQDGFAGKPTVAARIAPVAGVEPSSCFQDLLLQLERVSLLIRWLNETQMRAARSIMEDCYAQA